MVVLMDVRYFLDEMNEHRDLRLKILQNTHEQRGFLDASHISCGFVRSVEAWTLLGYHKAVAIIRGRD